MRDHVEGGSYNYNHTIRTAFPVSVSKDASTQTIDLDVRGVRDILVENMPSTSCEFPLVPTEDLQQSDYSDAMLYRIVKTEISDAQPFTYVFGDTDTLFPGTAASPESFGKQTAVVNINRQELESSFTPKHEKMDQTASGSNKTDHTLKGRPADITQSRKTKENKLDIENAKVKCEKCEALIVNKYMKKHLIRFHNEPKKQKSPGKKTKPVKTSDLKDIIEKAKLDETTYLKDTSKNPKLGKAHSQTDGSEKLKLDKDSKQNIVCETCGKQVKTRKNLRRHIKSVHEKALPKFECEKCGKKVQNLKVHVQNMHENYIPRGPAICETCGKVYPNTLSLARHKIVHTEKYLTCRYCSYLSSTHEEFQAHLKVHRRAKTYTCHVCNAVFNTPGNIHKHIRSIHMGERRYFCDVCNKGFYTKGHLQAHRAIHFEPTLKCSFCDRLFKEAGSKRIHERIHKGDQRYRCHICDHGFVQSGCYWSHMLKRHSIPKEEAMIIRQQLMAANTNQSNLDIKKMTADF